ncbi:hypothetical protein, partial [Microbulbifer sp.]|uniref:hypothetical protein n=1 Tax=Microbulbifer sp. TaxID=1908541 RepID=UPI002F950A95
VPGMAFQNRCEYIHVRCVGDVPVADAFEKPYPALGLKFVFLYFVSFALVALVRLIIYCSGFPAPT